MLVALKVVLLVVFVVPLAALSSPNGAGSPTPSSPTNGSWFKKVAKVNLERKLMKLKESKVYTIQY